MLWKSCLGRADKHPPSPPPSQPFPLPACLWQAPICLPWNSEASVNSPLPEQRNNKHKESPPKTPAPTGKKSSMERVQKEMRVVHSICPLQSRFGNPLVRRWRAYCQGKNALGTLLHGGEDQSARLSWIFHARQEVSIFSARGHWNRAGIHSFGSRTCSFLLPAYRLCATSLLLARMRSATPASPSADSGKVRAEHSPLVLFCRHLLLVEMDS